MVVASALVSPFVLVSGTAFGPLQFQPRPPKVGKIMAQNLSKAIILHAFGVQVNPTSTATTTTSTNSRAGTPPCPSPSPRLSPSPGRARISD